jgi:hypothetical protein
VYIYNITQGTWDCTTKDYAMVRNEFCKVDSLGFPKFTGTDLLRYKLLPKNMHFVTGEYYLWAYKASYLMYHKNLIINVAKEENIPVLLLAGVAVSEVGGMPDRLKSAGVLQFRQFIIDTIKGRVFNVVNDITIHNAHAR